jgi:hypothetical protein
MNSTTCISHIIHALIVTSLLTISAPIFAQDSTGTARQDSTNGVMAEKTSESNDYFAVLSTGPRSDQEIQKVAERYHKTLLHYYERELKTNPGLKGTIKLRLKIRADGAVIKATVLENSVGSGKLARSVQKHCLKWQFKRLRSGFHTVELELPFEPAGST